MGHPNFGLGLKSKVHGKVKGGEQECPPHTALHWRGRPRLHTADAFYLGQGFGLAVVADFRHAGGD
jgi:hypothetical protein